MSDKYEAQKKRNKAKREQELEKTRFAAADVTKSETFSTGTFVEDNPCPHCSSLFLPGEFLKDGRHPATCCKHGKIKLARDYFFDDTNYIHKWLTEDTQFGKVTINFFKKA